MTRASAPLRRLYSTALGCSAAGLTHADQVKAALAASASDGAAGSVSGVLPSSRSPMPMRESSAGRPTLCALLPHTEESSAGVPRSLK
jgi:hypothetical protein